MYYRVIKGWLAGCGASTAVIVAFTWIVEASTSPSGDLLRNTGMALVTGLFFFLIICLVTAFPAAAVIWVSERFSIRSIWFFGGAGAAMGAAVQLALIG